MGKILWEIKKIISCGNYNFAYVPEHPKAYKHGYVLEHRIVMENYIGRLLTNKEIVHHKNNNGKDNRLENLELFANEFEHKRMHGIKRKRKFADLRCPYCNKVFTRKYNQIFIYKNGKYTACSRSCNAKFSHIIKQNKNSKRINDSIKNNIVRIYSKQSI